jgi:cystathionine beta-synthase
VVIAPDTGRNYINKFYSDEWLQKNGFTDGTEDTSSLRDVIGLKEELPNLVAVGPRDTVKTAVDLMQQYSISQIPVVEDNRCLGSITESTLMKLLHDSAAFSRQEISAVMGEPLPVLDISTPVAEAYRVLLAGQTGIVVKERHRLRGFITRTDLIMFWARTRE